MRLTARASQYEEVAHVYLAALPTLPPRCATRNPVVRAGTVMNFGWIVDDAQPEWPDALGEGTIVDIEYGWSSTHEDLTGAPEEVAGGQF